MKKIVLVLSGLIFSLSSFASFNIENEMRQDTVDTLKTGKKTATSGVGSSTSNMYQDTMNKSRTSGKMGKMGKMDRNMDSSRLGGKNGKMQGSTSDGLMMKDGKMWMTKNGKTIPMDAEVTLDNGIRVMTDGTYMDKNGTTMRLKNGESIGMNGKMMPMKKNKMK